MIDNLSDAGAALSDGRIVPDEVHVRSWRRVWLAESMHTLHCPDGHRLADPLILDHGCIRCTHKAAKRSVDKSDCGKLVYVLGGFTTISGSPLVMCAEVTPSDMREMAAKRMDVQAVIRFLGIIACTGTSL